MQAAASTAKGIVSTLIVTNPTLAISLVDTIQMIKYVLYLNYTFPSLVISYFDLFSGVAEFNYFPLLVPENTDYMDPPPGFRKFSDTDAYLFRNINSYLWVTLLLGISYWIMKRYDRKVNYRDRSYLKIKILFKKIL